MDHHKVARSCVERGETERLVVVDEGDVCDPAAVEYAADRL
jgi:hypothetical protein